MDDEVLRWLVASLFGLAAGLLGLGGWLTPVAGSWHDGTRRLTLRQSLCYVRGRGEVAGGLQIYRGLALFGSLWLWRHDYGALHLRGLGFEAAQLQDVEGQVTGLFRLRLAAADVARPLANLVGTFSGKRFAFDGQRLRAEHYLPPEPRRWQRA